MITLSTRWPELIRRWRHLLYLLPIVYLLRPVLWQPIDYRFYNYFQSKRAVLQWSDVVVVGIDKPTLDELFPAPIYPLSRHADLHAKLTTNLHKMGASAIVIDLQFIEALFDAPPKSLVDAFRSTGKVYLGAFVVEERQSLGGGDSVLIRRAILPHDSLLAASQGAFVVDVRVDPDGCLRRLQPDERLDDLGLLMLPERLAETRITRPIPIEFPSAQQPLPYVSYREVLSGSQHVRHAIRGRIAFVGSVIDESTDYVAVPRVQQLPSGRLAPRMPGVSALASITQTLLDGAPLMDAPWTAVLLWNLAWALVVVTAMLRRRVVLSVVMLLGVTALAIVFTGVSHVFLGIVYPCGLLVGSVMVCGAFTIARLDLQTTKDLYRQEAEAERVRREMETARRTQEGLLPKKIPEIDGFTVSGTNISSLEVSGDYFDVIERAEAGSLILAIGDVSGKGLPAALLMSNLQAGLHARLAMEDFDLARTASGMNQLLCENTEPEQFATVLVAEFHPATRKLRYIRAGHEIPVFVSGEGESRMLEAGGIVMGSFPGFEYEATEVAINPGDVWCLYTDGVTEARNKEHEEFGVARLIDIVKAHRHQTAKQIEEAVVAAVRDFTRLERQADDVTLLILRADAE